MDYWCMYNDSDFPSCSVRQKLKNNEGVILFCHFIKYFATLLTYNNNRSQIIENFY